MIIRCLPKFKFSFSLLDSMRSDYNLIIKDYFPDIDSSLEIKLCLGLVNGSSINILSVNELDLRNF